MAIKKVKRETVLMAEAFEYYYSLGDSRSYDSVANKFHKSTRSICMWSDSFDWSQRVIDRDAKIAAKLQCKTIKDIVDTKANYRKIIKIAVKNLVDNLTATDDAGNPIIKVTSISDLEKLVKLDLTLMGEYTEIIKTEGAFQSQTSLSSADRESLKELVETIKKEIQAVANNIDEGDGAVH